MDILVPTKRTKVVATRHISLSQNILIAMSECQQ